ncbi:MAG: 2-C-methyl-D-erythritol 4-phosphate cytidylyltransferase [Dermatophilaceae bacterium]
MTDDAGAASRSVGVVVVAAGSGARLGAGLPKAFAELAGRPLLGHVLDTLGGWPRLGGLVLVVPEAFGDLGAARWRGIRPPDGARVVPGGGDRTASVSRGLAALDPACEVVLVHDAARCLTPLGLFDRVADAIHDGAAGAVPGLPVSDTVKTVDADGYVTGTPDRATLRAVQTPQGFDREVLVAAHASGLTATDDAALVERLGHRVRVVAGDPLAFKITTPDDLRLAERFLVERVGG